MSIWRVADQNGVSVLYIMLEINHSVQESSICSVMLLCCHYYMCMFVYMVN